jgi:hypothetical protein
MAIAAMLLIVLPPIGLMIIVALVRLYRCATQRPISKWPAHLFRSYRFCKDDQFNRSIFDAT